MRTLGGFAANTQMSMRSKSSTAAVLSWPLRPGAKARLTRAEICGLAPSDQRLIHAMISALPVIRLTLRCSTTSMATSSTYIE